MKKTILLSLVALMSLAAVATDWSFGGGKMYFNNSTTGWDASKMMLVIGNECWSETYAMEQTETADLWVVDLPAHWNGPSYMAVINNESDFDNGTWGSDNLKNASHYSAAYVDGLVASAEQAFIFIPQSADNSCELALYVKGEEPQPEPVVTNWCLRGSFNDWVEDADPFVSKEGGEEGLLYVTLTDLPATASYKFKVYGGGEWYGNNGTMTGENHTGWTFTTDANDCGLNTTIAGNYEFAWDTANHVLSVIYPEPEPGPEPTLQWFVKGSFNDWQGQALELKEGGAANTLYASIALSAGKEYEFKIQGGDKWYGADGLMTRMSHTDWGFSTTEEKNCLLMTYLAGSYEFAFDTASHHLTVVYPENEKQATLYDSPVKDNNPDVMLQAFYWAHEGNTANEYTAFGDVKWSALNEQAGEIAENFDLVWLAPSQETADYTGYLPMNYSKQGSFDEFDGHHGHSPWGTGNDLRNLIDNLHQGGAKVVADIVLNHTSAGHVDEYEGSDKNWCSWTLNDFGRYGQFQIDRTWITAEDEMFADDYKEGRINKWTTGDCGDYNTALLTGDEKDVSIFGGHASWDYTEYNSTYSRDLAHAKKEVREFSRAYLTWMRDSIGYDGFRFDFMKGFHGSHLAEYNGITAPYFSVAEVFEGSIDKQLGFLYDAQYKTYVFDFPGKFSVYNSAIRKYQMQNLYDLKSKSYKPLIFCDDNSKYVVTFIDNHDSFHEGSCLYGTANKMDDRQAHQALAYLLSMPGVPCVVYPYWNNYKTECKAFIHARKAAGVHSESKIVGEWTGSGAEGNNYYTAMIEGTNGYLFLKLGYDCVPTDAPYPAAPEGMEWKCAWANRDHAGVWYTAPKSVPTSVESAEAPAAANKRMQDGVVYIHKEDKTFTVQGQKVK